MPRPLPPLFLAALLVSPGSAVAAPLSDRSTEIVRLDCGNTLGRRETTLFANGTIRLRDGERGKETLGLAELGTDELDAFLRRLAEVDLSEVDQLDRGMTGDWVERCDLQLSLAGKAPRSFRFGRYDTLPLSLSQLLRVVDDLGAKVVELRSAEHLPQGYEPLAGDVLRRADGQLFEVIADTTDHKAVELWGVDQPLAVYVLRDHLRTEFVALVSRRKR